MDRLEKAISKQCDYIEDILIEFLRYASNVCAEYWDDRDVLDRELKNYLKVTEPHCSLVYVVDVNGRQRSSSISAFNIDEQSIGQDLSSRPYLQRINATNQKKFSLTDVYIDRLSRKPCITAMHAIDVDSEVRGYIAADFDLNDLSLKKVDDEWCQGWRQIKGDPSIRSTLFQQTRTRSKMDECLEEVLDVIKSLITDQGIFHAKLHFSSSRATLWPYNNPYYYQLHVLEEIINPKVCLVYAKTPYPEQASITASMVPEILKVFKSLREADETIYLRAASLNIMNGMVGLNFSCDGSHYMSAEEFLSKDLNFWFGVTTCDS